MRTLMRRWWSGHPEVAPCRLCGCPIQATPHGSIREGMRKHTETVHPTEALLVSLMEES